MFLFFKLLRTVGVLSFLLNYFHLVQADPGLPDIFVFENIKPGMVGDGLSSFSEAKGIEKFNFEVLGLRKDFLGTGNHVALVKLTDERFKGKAPVAGMSGSPVYINGKLLGAVAYGFGNFTDAPIIGIVPIEKMIKGASGQNTGKGLAKPISLALVGLAPKIAQILHSQLDQRGLSALSSDGGLVGADEKGTLKPQLVAGGPVAAALVVGDVNIAAVGTVTLVNGTKFYAFGHPFLGIGKSEIPVLNAEVVTTLFSGMESLKIGQPTGVIGRLIDDSLFGLTGVLGSAPTLIPMSITLGDKTWKMGLAKNPRDTLFYALLALGNVLSYQTAANRGGIYTVAIEIEQSNGQMVKFERKISKYYEQLESFVVSSLSDDIGFLFQEYESIKLKNIAVNIQYDATTKDSQLIQVQSLNHVKNDKKLTVRLTSRTFSGEQIDNVIPLQFPSLLKKGMYDLIVADRSSVLSAMREPSSLLNGQIYKNYIERFKNLPNDDELCFYVETKNPLVLNSLKKLNDIYSANGQNKNQMIKLGCKQFDGVIEGNIRAKIQIEG